MYFNIKNYLKSSYYYPVKHIFTCYNIILFCILVGGKLLLLLFLTTILLLDLCCGKNNCFVF